MFRRFANARVVKALSSLKNKLPSSIPKATITATVDSLLPTGRLANIMKRETFAQQLLKKNQERAVHFAKEMIHMVVHGSKSAYKDAKYLTSITSTKPKKSYTVDEIKEVKRISRDLLKFIPFYAALLIPGGEIPLIPYLYLFPRAVPSYFMSENAITEQKYKYQDNQIRAHDALRAHLLTAMEKLGYDVTNRNADDMTAFFMENQATLLDTLSTKNMNSDMLINAADFLMFEYVQGTFILNTVYKTTVNLPRYGINLAMWVARNSYRAVWDHPFFNYEFKLNNFMIEPIKKRFIKYQFEKQLKHLRAQNFAMASGFYGEMKEERYLEIAQERGCDAKNEEDVKKWLKEEWNPMAEQNLKNDMLMFWYSVMQFGRL